ncbi:hypothetical protein G6F57_007071 [Rhizopus arrhizus]|nr:hypothetical protein G6F22_012563 [Rhizopus arrhizus]KAG1417534.1 hypothetical protein G6F58_005473 [Rhizopus delemar]KAG0787753.1 hypothetical protein G6F21_007695 [Rhizopus arrhizus]KAG0810961.1 hypothetical protein G6F20_007540 [Rhizopus arrhizus]KAG0829456.1 hypothetical protein G6F19_007728 [Rhizopus arrhizus]
MFESLPIPLPPATIDFIAKTFDISQEEASTTESFLLFKKHMKSIRGPANVEREDRTIEFDHIKADITIIRPLKHENKILPVILYLHGGGWIVGDYDDFSSLVNEIANHMSCCVVFVEYSLSPKVKHPVALEECYASLCWVQQNAQALNVDLNRLAVAGDSAGGNLTAALSILAKQRGNSGITHQVLFYPAVDNNFETESYSLHKDNAALPREWALQAWQLYAAKEEDYNSPLMAPLKATLEELSGLPPALVITAENDVLRSEGEAYAKKLAKAGVPTISVTYHNVSHGFASAAMPESYLVVAQMADWLNRGWKSTPNI